MERDESAAPVRGSPVERRVFRVPWHSHVIMLVLGPVITAGGCAAVITGVVIGEPAVMIPLGLLCGSSGAAMLASGVARLFTRIVVTVDGLDVRMPRRLWVFEVPRLERRFVPWPTIESIGVRTVASGDGASRWHAILRLAGSEPDLHIHTDTCGRSRELLSAISRRSDRPVEDLGIFNLFGRELDPY